MINNDKSSDKSNTLQFPIQKVKDLDAIPTSDTDTHVQQMRLNYAKLINANSRGAYSFTDETKAEVRRATELMLEMGYAPLHREQDLED